MNTSVNRKLEKASSQSHIPRLSGSVLYNTQIRMESHNMKLFSVKAVLELLVLYAMQYVELQTITQQTKCGIHCVADC